MTDLNALIDAERADRDGPTLCRPADGRCGARGRAQRCGNEWAACSPSYGKLLINAVGADQERGAVPDTAAPEALATLLDAVADGMFLHALPGADRDAFAARGASLDGGRSTQSPATG
jgi:hypothetical protein